MYRTFFQVVDRKTLGIAFGVSFAARAIKYVSQITYGVMAHSVQCWEQVASTNAHLLCITSTTNEIARTVLYI